LYDHDCWFDHHGIYDVTLKVPLIIRYPKKLQPNRRVAGFNQLMDLTPTLLDLAGIKSGVKFDGRSLLPMVKGRVASHASSFYLTECTWMRKHGWRTPEWKLIHALEPDFHFKPEVELYNLVEDPDENVNVARQHPDIVAVLEAQMQDHIARRERETGKANPIYNQPHWHGHADVAYFTSSQQAYDTLHIGSAKMAQKLQAGKKGK
jgi:arylsulfatase A-like enzyme